MKFKSWFGFAVAFVLGCCTVGFWQYLVRESAIKPEAEAQAQLEAEAAAKKAEAEKKAKAEAETQAKREVSESSSSINFTLPANIQLEMVHVESGTFIMGKRDGANVSNEREHSVTLKNDFWIGKTEVTQAQWKAVMGNNPSNFKGDNLPVENVSWNDCRAFCAKLNELYAGKLPSGYQFDLPTEAQWEYAARGGNKSNGYKYGGSNDISSVAWYKDNSGEKTHPVGEKEPNELGLYDMSGNVFECCRDWYESYYAQDPEFLSGNAGTHRVNCGGSWYSNAESCRLSFRNNFVPAYRYSNLGLRLALARVQNVTEPPQEVARKDKPEESAKCEEIERIRKELEQQKAEIELLKKDHEALKSEVERHKKESKAIEESAKRETETQVKREEEVATTGPEVEKNPRAEKKANAELMQATYKLLVTVKRQKDQIDSLHYDRGQTFGKQLDILIDMFTAGKCALDNKEIAIANSMLKEAEAAANWLIENGPLRVEVQDLQKQAVSKKAAADKYEGSKQSYAEYSEAQTAEKNAETEYEKGNFPVAASLLKTAIEKYGKAKEQARAKYEVSGKNYTLTLPGNIQLEMVRVEAGTFTMGKQDGENYAWEKEHSVTLKNDFWIGKTEVTQAQWKAVMGNNPSDFKGDNLPVENVNWNDCKEFCAKLNKQFAGKLPSGYRFDLPTEAQWEYAARGGKKSRGYKYSGSNDIDRVAWYCDNADKKTHPVGEKEPNGLGLYDMTGNVVEWCRDWYESDYASDPEFLSGNTGSDRVVRGGSWSFNAMNCRSSYRNYNDPTSRNGYLGLRLALVRVQ